MATHRTSRLLTLVILQSLTVGSIQSFAEPRDQASAEDLASLADSARQGDEEKKTNESPSSSDRFAAGNFSLIPDWRAAAVCMTGAHENDSSARDSCGLGPACDAAKCAQLPEPDGEGLSFSVIPGEESSRAPSGLDTNTCNVLVAGALAPFQYFVDNDFLSRLSALTSSNADYFDTSAATPTLAQLSPYDMVIAFVDANLADRTGMGDVLADYLEAGGKVILGNYTHHTEGVGEWLDGRIMDEYSPVLVDERRWRANYTGDGTDCIFAGVPTFQTLPYNHIDSLVGSAGSDGTYYDPELDDSSTLAAYRLDRSVYYVAGHMAGWLSAIPDPPATQAWAQLTANICYCAPEQLFGACCDPFAGTCTDDALAGDCRPPLQWTDDATCAELDPPCGNPGSCCDDSTGSCTQRLEKNCAGRFEAGAACSAEPFVPACGQTGTCNILYAPTVDDNPRLRADIASLTASQVDYYDAREGTPSLIQLMQYDTVVTWVGYAFDDSVAMGDRLADFVEAGGRVILGLWSAPGGNNQLFLEGRLMEEYNPITIGGLDWGGTTYADDGVDCIHDDVSHYSPRVWDQIAEVAPDAWSDGTYLNEAGERYPSVAYRHDRKVFYISGFDGEGALSGPGDWAQLIANICSCPTVDPFGACCDAITATCTDDVRPTDCLPPLQWTLDVQCADLSPQCGNPGACCDHPSNTCSWELELDCSGRFRPGQTCESQPFAPPCEDYAPCPHSIVMRDDSGNGWNGNTLDVYVGGFPVLTGVTLADGSGPESVFFFAEAGEEIATVWTPSFLAYEASYCITGLDGTSLGCDGFGGDFPTGITVFGDCTEVACGDGICQLGGGENCVNCVPDCGDCGCVSQPSLEGGVYLSDVDCQSCDSGVQVLADNFRTFDETRVLGIRFWGAYAPNETGSQPDQFTVVFREDTAGLPGAVIATYGSVAGTRTLIGDNEYEYVIALDETLPVGSHWLEVYNETNDTQDTWGWYAGQLDPTYGRQGLAFSLEMPESWLLNGSIDLAFELICAAGVTIRLDKSNEDVSIDWDAQPGYTYDVLHSPWDTETWTREENVSPPWHHVGAANAGQDYVYGVEAIPVVPPAP